MLTISLTITPSGLVAASIAIVEQSPGSRCSKIAASFERERVGHVFDVVHFLGFKEQQ